MNLFIKVESKSAAEELKTMGFDYVTEVINSKTFYCFEFKPELAQIIMAKFADERLMVDDHLHF